MLSHVPDGSPPGLAQEPNSAPRAGTPNMGRPSAERSRLKVESRSDDFPRRVLLVEPSPTERARLRNILIGGQLEVSTASDLITALHALSSFQPNLILAQMRLPTHGGIELLRHANEHYSMRSVPMILYGDIVTVEERIIAFNLGATDLISEPFVSAELIARLRASLRARHKLSILEKRAHLDSLTGLANRGVLEDHLLREWNACHRRGVPLAVVILDLDFFKTINDTFGHAAGDEVLRQTAKRLAQSVRSSDLVARYGGEEFVVVAPDCPLEAVLTMVQRFRASLADRTISAAGTDIAVTASAGIALANRAHQNTPEDLLRQADVALYRAKGSGRNTVWVYYESAHGGPATVVAFASGRWNTD
jgi:two-component system, cell cycle response regulator